MFRKNLWAFAVLLLLPAFCGSGGRRAASETPFGMLAASDDHSLLPEGCYLLSAYDNIIRRVSDREGNDWRLVSAIAYHESRFTADRVSARGARGLMQVRPVVAREFGVPAELLSDPAINVRLANLLLNRIGRMLELPADMPERERLGFVLAGYNSGPGHVADARRLAAAYGEDPDRWEVVARYLGLKSDPEYYRNEVVRHGRFVGGRQTADYVGAVLARYDRYCGLAER